MKPIKTRLWYEYLEKHPNFTGVLVDMENDVAHFVNGQYHRVNGPAIELANGGKAYFKNGQRHRDDGPAVDHHNSKPLWFLNDIEYYSEHEWKLAVRKLKLSLLT